MRISDWSSDVCSSDLFDEAKLGEKLFGPRPYAEVLIGELGGAPQGFALFFHNFSTFEGRPGIYLEDLFVRPEARGSGLGKALLAHLAKLCVARSEEHTSELPSLLRISYAVFCLKKKTLSTLQTVKIQPH